jgi:hypothetical protein
MSCSRALLGQTPVVQLLKKVPTFHGGQMFITAYTTASHWSLSGAQSLQSLPSKTICPVHISMLYTHLRFGFHSSPFFLSISSISLINVAYFPFLPHVLPISLFYFITIIITGGKPKLFNASLRSSFLLLSLNPSSIESFIMKRDTNRMSNVLPLGYLANHHDKV